MALSAGLLAAWGCGPEAQPRFDPTVEIVTVRRAWRRLEEARDRVETSGTRRSPAASASEHEAARAQFVGAYDEAQEALTGFLRQTMACCPRAPELDEALTLYGRQAMAHARFLLANGGDAHQASAVLQQAKTLYVANNRVVPRELTHLLGTILSAPTPAPILQLSATPRAQ